MDHSWADLKSKLDNNVNLSVEDNKIALECMEHLPAMDRQDRKKTILVLCDLRFPFFFDMVKSNFPDIKKGNFNYSNTTNLIFRRVDRGSRFRYLFVL